MSLVYKALCALFGRFTVGMLVVILTSKVLKLVPQVVVAEISVSWNFKSFVSSRAQKVLIV